MTRLLETKGVPICVLLGRPSAAPGRDIPSGGPTAQGDICERPFVRKLLRETQPSKIIHLAGGTPARMETTGVDFLRVNVLGTWSLLDGVRSESPGATTVVISSSAVYGMEGKASLREGCPLEPGSEYGASKAVQEMLAFAFGVRHGLRIVRARPFNLVGPGEPKGQVCSAIAHQIASAELGFAPPVVRVGRLDSSRDFIDVRDAVAAYMVLGERGRIGEAYNICSGKAVQVGEILDRLLAMSRLKVRVIHLESVPIEGDVDSQVGSYEKIGTELGWKPSIPLDQSLRELLDWYRGRLVEEPGRWT